MKGTATLILTAIVFVGIAMMPADANAQGAPGYAGEDSCLNGCHVGSHAAILSNYQLSGHRYKLNPIKDGVLRAYPAGRVNRDGDSPAEVTRPAGTEWTDFAYVIGGYGWKARFVRTNGRIYTDDAEAQQNLFATVQNGAPLRVTYHEGDPNVKYNFACFQCHTTGATAEGSWNGVPADALGDFRDPGVTCEGCHGPSETHALGGAFQNPPILPPNTGDFLRVERCIECHQRGGATSAIPVSGSYIRHHEQGNEFRASKHGDGEGVDLTCASCHNQHVPNRYPNLSPDGAASLVSCDTSGCHETKSIPTVDGVAMVSACADCHMPKASKSALGFQMGNGWKGDVPTHLMKINTNPVTREAMFTADDGSVLLDANGHGAVTMDFACLGCHTNKTVGWAANYTASMHTTGIHTSTDDLADVPVEYELGQNYPNPFNPTTTISFKLPETADVKISIYSVDGRLVQTILRQRMPSGSHQITMNADFLSSGTYLYRLTAGSYIESKMMTLLK